MTQLRHFRPGDTARIVQVWNRALPADPMTAERFTRQILLDRNFDARGLLLAETGDQLIGACYVVRRRVAEHGSDTQPDTGWLLFFFVAPEQRRAGVASALLDAGDDFLREQGVTRVLFSSYTPNYLTPGLDAERYPEAASLLAGRGFTARYRCVAMDTDLGPWTMPDGVAARIHELSAQGYRLGGPSRDDLPELIELATTEFNPDWGRAIREAVLDGLDLEQIQIVRDPTGTLLGWAMFGCYEQVIDRFGPFGVTPASRGLGLGRVLLGLTLRQMKARGAHHAWFLWTDPASAAGQLYLSTGFCVTREFRVLSTPLVGTRG